MDKKTDLVEYSYELGKHLLEKRQIKTIKEHGQFLTPPSIARFMAQQLGTIHDGAYLLEPAIGSGVLICAIAEHLIKENRAIDLWVDAYETDPELCELSRQILNLTMEKASNCGINIHWRVYQEDFILACLPEDQPSLFTDFENRRKSYHYVIGNPPYFKLNKEDIRVKAVSGKIKGHTNIYTLFMALSAKMLLPEGRACFIVPRSFCSGVYFSEFRREFLKDSVPVAVHLFQSREDVFKGEEILQENVVFSFDKSSQPRSRQYWSNFINISTSQDDSKLNETQISRQVQIKYFIGNRNKQIFFRIPTGVLDEQILDSLDKWDNFLERSTMQVSTGPVVPFRSRNLLNNEISENNETVPFLWMQNVKPYKVEWPLECFDKPQAISVEQKSLLVPNSNYVLLRRFSAKEDRRRLISAPFLKDHFPYSYIGFENHLNYIYRTKDELQPFEALGLSAILNSALIDRYFRIVNGNTQVNAAELRALPLPPMEVIRQIGGKIQNIQNPSSEIIDKIVFTTLWESNLLEDGFPMIKETRITMGKIEQAQEILEALGLPRAQQNEMSALTILVLAQLSEETPWEEAKKVTMRVHDILLEIKRRYGREYAENTRETIRRQALQQFEQAGIVLRNPEDPTLATNSPRTHYVLSDSVLSAIQAYGAPEWESKSFELPSHLIHFNGDKFLEPR